MTYPAGEALIATVLQGVTGFTSANVVRGKFGVLNTGRSDHYAIIKPGAFKISDQAQIGTIWRTTVMIYQRYKDDGDSMVSLETRIDAAILRVRQYRKLGDTTGTVIDSSVTEGTEVNEIWTKGGGVSWLRQSFTIEWSEQNNVTYAE